MTGLMRRSAYVGLIAVLVALTAADQARGANWLHGFRSISLDRDLSGYLASALVLAAFAMQSMRPLRVTAIASNVAFIVYALSAHLLPILILHSLLLPLNAVRLLQLGTSKWRRAHPSASGAG